MGYVVDYTIKTNKKINGKSFGVCGTKHYLCNDPQTIKNDLYNKYQLQEHEVIEFGTLVYKV